LSTPPSFPTLRGQGWSVDRTPINSTIIASHVSGREVRNPQYVNPLWEFELTFDGLTDLASPPANYAGLGASSFQAIMGLYLYCQGSFKPFLFNDPDFNSVTSQLIATGDGTTTAFTFVRPWGSLIVEPVGWVLSVSSVTVGGVPQNTGWSLITPNSLSFLIAPASAAPIVASFTYASLCRFSEDSLTLKEFMKNLHMIESLKIRSVRSSF
jgi:hypothetical protein